MAVASQVGANTVITVDAENTITLTNVSFSSLHRDDFAFVDEVKYEALGSRVIWRFTHGLS